MHDTTEDLLFEIKFDLQHNKAEFHLINIIIDSH